MTGDERVYRTIDEYIANFPEDVQVVLEELRETVRKAAPDVHETIKYQIPTFVQEGILVHFAGYKNHIGFYPTPSGIERFKQELSAYEGGKGSVKFPLDKPVPYGLISQIVKFRVQENLARPESKSKVE